MAVIRDKIVICGVFLRALISTKNGSGTHLIIATHVKKHLTVPHVIKDSDLPMIMAGLNLMSHIPEGSQSAYHFNQMMVSLIATYFASWITI